jgi:hypothetical protein
MTPSQQTATMIFGVVLVAAGIVMLVVLKLQGANRIRLLGAEFELSTPSLIVLLAGCGLFLAPFLLDGGRDGQGGTRSSTAKVGAQPTARATTLCGMGEIELEAGPVERLQSNVLRVPVLLHNLTKYELGRLSASDVAITDDAGLQYEQFGESNWATSGVIPDAKLQGTIDLRDDRATHPGASSVAVTVGGVTAYPLPDECSAKVAGVRLPKPSG